MAVKVPVDCGQNGGNWGTGVFLQMFFTGALCCTRAIVAGRLKWLRRFKAVKELSHWRKPAETYL